MMDPIGFSLENFDAVGQWRARDSGFPVNASGQLIDGTKVDGPVALRGVGREHLEQTEKDLRTHLQGTASEERELGEDHLGRTARRQRRVS